MKRRDLLLTFGAGIVAPIARFVHAQERIRRIGILSARGRPTPENPDVVFDVFVQAMKKLGYVEGKNLAIEWRFADGKYERLPALAAELVRLNPEVILTHATPPNEALRRTNTGIPIVNAAMTDPVGSGFAATLARPGGNITGLSLMNIDLGPKQLELLKLIVPGLSRVAVLANPDTSVHQGNLKSIQAAAQQVGLRILLVEARNPDDIDRGFAAMKRDHADGMIALGDSFFIQRRRQITELAKRNRLPSMFVFREDVEAGGLISYGQNLTDNYRRAANYVDKILQGAKPGEMPIEQPTKIHLAINLKTAKALGLYVSKELVFKADEVIE